MEEKTITQFLNNELKEFAYYVLENRAIPSVIDGFKPSQRKVIHIASKTWKTGNEKILKVFQLGGKVASDAYYHHGDKSLSDTIIRMAQKFKNTTPLLEEDGQFGKLRSPEAGAPRYIGTKLSPYFKMIYKDQQLLEFKEEEGEKIEPHYFLPLVPMILVNAGSGIAVGFSSTILSREMNDVISSCMGYLRNGRLRKTKPHINGFTGDFIQDTENEKRWFIRGKFERINTTTVHISELPPSMTYRKYEEHLDKILEDKAITGYDNKCKGNINYIIKFKRNILGSLSDDEMIKLLQLEDKVTENFTTLNEKNKIELFDTDKEIIKYFVDFRLKYFQKRKDHIIDNIQKDIILMSNRAKFIKLVLDKKIIINNRSKADIVKDIIKYKIPTIENSHDYLLRTQLFALTKEMVNKLLKDIKDKEVELKAVKKKKPKDMYMEDLETLKKEITSYEKRR